MIMYREFCFLMDEYGVDEYGFVVLLALGEYGVDEFGFVVLYENCIDLLLPNLVLGSVVTSKVNRVNMYFS